MTIYRDQLEAVYRLIEDPKRWTQGAYARRDDGTYDYETPSFANESDATSWCLWGAVVKCGIPPTYDCYYTRILGFMNDWEVNEFNDSHTHAEVLDLLRKAIERAPVRPC